MLGQKLGPLLLRPEKETHKTSLHLPQIYSVGKILIEEIGGPVCAMSSLLQLQILTDILQIFEQRKQQLNEQLRQQQELERKQQEQARQEQLEKEREEQRNLTAELNKPSRATIKINPNQMPGLFMALQWNPNPFSLSC
jgi:hypothetical protein